MEAMVMRRESVVRGEVLKVQWTTLGVHVSVLDYGECLDSDGWAKWCRQCFVA